MNKLTHTKELLFVILILSFHVIIASDKNEPLVKDNMDTAVSPGTDFYQYANGGWLKANPIPDDHISWGTSEILEEENYKIVQAILENAAQKSKSATKGKILQQVGDFYTSGMDTLKIEKEGITPIEPYLNEISKINSKADVINQIIRFQQRGSNPLFAIGSGPDLKNTEINAAYIEQSGLGLPDRDYYLNDDERSKEIRSKYVEHITNMLKLAGKNEMTAKSDAEKILNMETQLAKNSFTRLENRDPYKTYNKMGVDSLMKLAPNVLWKKYLTAINLAGLKEIIVSQPKFFSGLSQILFDTPAEDWKPYFEWYVLRRSASYLSSSFVEERFSFMGKFLNGLKAMQPRWKRVMNNTNDYLGDAVGQLYVKDNFPPEAKQRARDLVMNLLSSMKERITAVDWMSEATKQEALKKLAAFTVKIGYTDKWEDYTGFDVTKDSYLQNIINGNAFHFKKDIDKIGKPFDKVKWGMNAQEVNAYYSAVKNEIAFPAAILRPPYFDPNADDAVNYGAIGAVIGHEITHGFDNRGRQYDYQGNLKDWWTEEDNTKFKEKARRIIDQYNGFAVVDTNKINGELTQGENIADLGGLNVAFNAFKKTDQYKNNEIINGFTPTQRFFFGYAQGWRNNIRDESLLLDLKTDVHSPGKQRVNGPLSNMPEFWEAFNVKPGDPMRNPDDKIVKIW